VRLLKYLKGASVYIVIIIAIILVLGWFFRANETQERKYSDFRVELGKQNIESIILEGNKALVTLKRPRTDGIALFSMYVPDVTVFMNDIEEDLSENRIELKANPPSSGPNIWVTILPMIILAGVIFVVWIFFMQQSQGGGGTRVMSFGKSRAKLATDERRKVTFADVAGADEEKEELQEIVEFLKHPNKFNELGARIPKGVLLVGPPGTGKTLLAKAVAGEAGVPFFTISGSDFVEMFVGVGASRVRDLFDQAKKSSPCIVFIDEIDAVGRHRGAGLGNGHDEREQTLNQLLVEMDGFSVNAGVIIIAATNRRDILDPALTRPGRFDRNIVVGLPDIKGREEILNVHARNKPIGSDVKMAEIAKTTPGFTGADLENLLNEAALLSARENKDDIGMEQIKEAAFKVIMGPEKKSRIMTDHEKKLTAYHEAGHAIAVRVASTNDRVDRISIIPAGMAGGYTFFKPQEDKRHHTRSQLLEKIIISLGGRAAEELVLGEISTGAYGDLKQANGIARDMITRYGMSEKLSNMIFGSENDEVFIGRSIGHSRNYSEELAAQIDEEVKEIIEASYKKALQILTDNMEKLHSIANLLLEKEKIEGEEFEEIFSS
jgi:cell division protease FtsH